MCPGHTRLVAAKSSNARANASRRGTQLACLKNTSHVSSLGSTPVRFGGQRRKRHQWRMEIQGPAGTRVSRPVAPGPVAKKKPKANLRHGKLTNHAARARIARER